MQIHMVDQALMFMTSLLSQMQWCFHLDVFGSTRLPERGTLHPARSSASVDFVRSALFSFITMPVATIRQRFISYVNADGSLELVQRDMLL